MAADMFLEIDGIKGESHDDKHKDTIEILSFSWGASNSGTFSGGGGGGAGKVTMQDITFATTVNKASPELLSACAKGTHIKKATLFVRKAGGEQQDYYVIKFDDLMVSSWQNGGSGGDLPMENFSLNFSKYQFEYKPQKEDGSLEAAVVSKYSLKERKA
jgi:type VI secretion system secreted protein Hcp